MLLYLTSKRQNSVWKNEYMKKRKTHGEFALTSEFSAKQFTNYFRLNRSQFNAVHRLVQISVYSEGCNANKTNWNGRKTLCVLKVFYFLYLNCLQKHYSQCYRISSIISRNFVAILVYLKIGCGLDSMALIFAKFYLSTINAYR